MRGRSMLAVVGLVACGGEPEVTWHADISPMMQQHCSRCHTEGGLGVGDFTDLEQVRTFSERIVARTADGTMPPPVADPECRDYVGSEHLSLPQGKKDLFAEWIALGMPEGDPETAPELDLPEQELSEADLQILMPEPYEPAFEDPQNPGNEYRCFVLDHGRDEPFFVTGFHPVIGEPALVHHVVLLLVDADDVPETYDPAVGVDCMEGRAGAVGDVSGMVAGWAPGMSPVRLDGSRGIRVGPDQRLVVQMHYYQAGPHVDGLSDQSGYAMTTASDVDVPLRMVPFGLYDFEIPAGDAAYSHSDSVQLPAGVTGRVHAVFPHMHVLGTGYHVWRTDSAGTEHCIARGDYTFDNQLSYVFKEPMPLESGDRLHLECTWDNSTGNPDRILEEPVTTTFGERTDEEMCYAFSLISIGQ